MQRSLLRQPSRAASHLLHDPVDGSKVDELFVRDLEGRHDDPLLLRGGRNGGRVASPPARPSPAPAVVDLLVIVVVLIFVLVVVVLVEVVAVPLLVVPVPGPGLRPLALVRVLPNENLLDAPDENLLDIPPVPPAFASLGGVVTLESVGSSSVGVPVLHRSLSQYWLFIRLSSPSLEPKHMPSNNNPQTSPPNPLKTPPIANQTRHHPLMLLHKR